MIVTFVKGYILFEALIALWVAGIVLTIGLNHQAEVVKQAAQQFEELWAINQLHNLVERFRANPLFKEQEFKTWLAEMQKIMPEAKVVYQCQLNEHCEVFLEWAHQKFHL